MIPIVRFFSIALLGLAAGAAMAAPVMAAGPLVPCGQAPVPAFPPEGGTPASGVWQPAELRQSNWSPPACLGWSGDTRLVAALASTFRSSLSLDQLIGRATNVAAWPSIKYWSVSRQQWRPVASEARSIPPPGGERAGLYFTQQGEAGQSTHRMAILERSGDRAVIVQENVSAIRVAVVTAFEPGALQAAIVLERTGPELWHLYQLMRVGAASSSLTTSSPGSYVNRMVAFHRALAGVPTDSEPPLVPR